MAAVEINNRRIKRADYRAGILVATVENLLKKKEEEPSQPFDRFPQHQKPKERLEYRINRRRQAIQQLNAAKLRAQQKVEKLAKEEKKNGDS